MEKFKELGISEEILKSLENIGFDEPTEIQIKSIPSILEGKDVIAASATGSGKTLAFGSGIITGTIPKNGIQTLILTPTRELAEQIHDALRIFSKYKPLKIITVYGGVSINPQIDNLKNADIVVGTPGRVLDHIDRGTINLTKIKFLVLDEADRMLDMGFIDDVNKILNKCPKEKQMLLFSATIPPDIEDLTNHFMDNPVRIKAEVFVNPKKMNQVYFDVKSNLKFSLLLSLLKKESTGLIMVFCNSRRYVDLVSKNLKKSGIEALAIHGGLSQNKRSNVLSSFNSGKTFVLVCTDVASRGLDIPGVSHVYNYDSPDDSKQYIHRIGRTARAGKSGKIINLISDRDHENFGRILNDFDIDIKKEELPVLEKFDLVLPKRNSFSNKGRRTNSYSRKPIKRYAY